MNERNDSCCRSCGLRLLPRSASDWSIFRPGLGISTYPIDVLEDLLGRGLGRSSLRARCSCCDVMKNDKVLDMAGELNSPDTTLRRAYYWSYSPHILQHMAPSKKYWGNTTRCIQGRTVYLTRECRCCVKVESMSGVSAMLGSIKQMRQGVWTQEIEKGVHGISLPPVFPSCGSASMCPSQRPQAVV
jgi:hypothetical protein